MIKSLKLFSSVIKKNEAAKQHSFCAPSMADVIKFNSTTIIYVPFFLSLSFFLEIILFQKNWSSYLILTCSLVVLSLFLGFRAIMRLFQLHDKTLRVVYYIFLSLSSSLLIVCLIVKLIGFEIPSSIPEINNEKTSLFFTALVVSAFYAYIFSLIRIGTYRMVLTVFHKVVFICAILISMRLDAFYYFQNVLFEMLSLSLLFFSTKTVTPKAGPDSSRCPISVKKINNHNEWKAMVNEFPIGVVILSPDKKVMFSNKTVQDMFELQLNNHPISTINPTSVEKEDISITFIKDSATPMNGNSINSHLKDVKRMKISFEELNVKIGKLEEVEDIRGESSSPVERSHSFSSSNELTILSHKSKTFIRKHPYLNHYNSVNPNYSNEQHTLLQNNSFRSRNSKHSNSIYSSVKVQERDREMRNFMMFAKEKPQMRNFKEGGGRRYQTEKIINFKESEDKSAYGKTKIKTKIVKIRNKDCDLDQIIEMNKKAKNSSPKTPKEGNSKSEAVLPAVKTYCTQFKNFKKSDNIKKKFQLKIQTISYKQKESFLILIEDVTYMDSIAHLRENNEYKNKIMTTLSHEIRTPLNGAIPALEEVVFNLDEEFGYLRDSLLIPLKSLYLLQNVLGDAVDFALINSNQLYLNYEECNIFEFLKETVEIFSLQANEKNIDLSFNFTETKLPPRKVIADFQRIRQILVSLIGNSMKNTSEGAIDISIEVGPALSPMTPKVRSAKTRDKTADFRKIISMESDSEKQEKLVMKFAVSDTGFGIDPFKLVNIKQCLKEKNPLEVCNNLNRDTGCGLGLTISHCLAMILGPKNNSGLKIESTIGNGTTTEFFIEFLVDKTSFKEFLNTNAKALSTIRETKEITRYSTKKRVEGQPTATQSKFMSRLLTSNSKASKVSGVSRTSKVTKSMKISTKSNIRKFSFQINKIPRSISCDLTKLASRPLILPKRNKFVSQNNSPIQSNHFIKEPKEIEPTVGSIGRDSAHISQYQRNHQFTVNFEGLFLSPLRSESGRREQQHLYTSKSTISHHFDELLRNGCECEEALVVDDDAFNLKSLELLLSKFQKRCVKAYNGEEAIKIITEKYSKGLCGDRCKGFRIIFMDYHMPIKNGVETTRILKQRMDLHELPNIPIIACTAFGAKDLVEEWGKAGMTHFITKPITAKKIEAILEKWV